MPAVAVLSAALVAAATAAAAVIIAVGLLGWLFAIDVTFQTPEALGEALQMRRLFVLR
jgi:hypothetical protein